VDVTVRAIVGTGVLVVGIFVVVVATFAVDVTVGAATLEVVGVEAGADVLLFPI
jgi:hypothetical protein